MSGSQIEGTSRKWNKPSENKTQGILWRGRLRDKIGERPPSLSPSPRAFFASFLSWSLEQTVIDNLVRALQINAWANVLDRKPLLAIKVSSRTWLWAGVCSNCTLRLFWDEPCFLCNLILANTKRYVPLKSPIVQLYVPRLISNWPIRYVQSTGFASRTWVALDSELVYAVTAL